MKEAFFVGEKVYLRPLNELDAEGNYPYWFNDSEVCRYNRHARFPNTKEKTLEYIKSVKDSLTELVLAIVDKKDNKHIGNVSLSRINYIDSNAELSIIIGEKDYWGKGIGKEAWEMVMDYGFKTLNLHRLYCGTHAENIGMQKIALACGMKEEGKLIDAVFKNGKYADIILYGAINNYS